MIAGSELIGREENDVKIATKVPVLKGIVQYQDIDGELSRHVLRGARPALVNNNHHTVKLGRHHRRLVTGRVGLGAEDLTVADNHRSRASPLVAAAEDSDFAPALRQHPGEQLDERGFSDAAGGNIPDGDDGDSRFVSFQNPDIKEQVTERDPRAIHVREGKQERAHNPQTGATWRMRSATR
jgi:hypothetical protein